MDCHPPQAASTQGKLLAAVAALLLCLVESQVVEAKSLLEAAALGQVLP